MMRLKECLSSILQATMGHFNMPEGLTKTWFKVWVGETSDLSYTVTLALSPATRSHDVIIADRSLDHNNRETFRVNRMTSRMGNGWGYRHFTNLLLLDLFLLQTTHHSDSSPNGVWLAPATLTQWKPSVHMQAYKQDGQPHHGLSSTCYLCLGPETLRMVVGKLWCSCSPGSPGLLKAVLGTGTNVMLQLI